MGLDQAIQTAARFIVKNDGIQIAGLQTCIVQAKTRCAGGEARISLFPFETLLLSSRNNQTVLHQSSGGIVVVSGDSQNIHSKASSFLNWDTGENMGLDQEAKVYEHISLNRLGNHFGHFGHHALEQAFNTGLKRHG